MTSLDRKLPDRRAHSSELHFPPDNKIPAAFRKLEEQNGSLEGSLVLAQAGQVVVDNGKLFVN